MEGTDHQPNGTRTHLNRGEPHRNTSNGPHNKADKDQKLEIAVKEGSRDGTLVPHVEPLQIAHQEAATNRKLSEEDVENPESTDGQALH